MLLTKKERELLAMPYTMHELNVLISEASRLEKWNLVVFYQKKINELQNEEKILSWVR